MFHPFDHWAPYTRFLNPECFILYIGSLLGCSGSVRALVRIQKTSGQSVRQYPVHQNFCPVSGRQSGFRSSISQSISSACRQSVCLRAVQRTKDKAGSVIYADSKGRGPKFSFLTVLIEIGRFSTFLFCLFFVLEAWRSSQLHADVESIIIDFFLYRYGA